MEGKIKITNKTKKIIERDKKVFLTTTRAPYPFIADHGRGDFVFDIEGNKFIDFTSFISVYNFGVDGIKGARAAAKAQIDKLMHSAFLDFRAEPPVRFAELLLKQFPDGFGKVFLSNSGTEAVEAALKIAQVTTKKPYILAYYNAFHGRTKGSLALTNTKLTQREYFGPFPNVVHVPYPYCYRCPFKQKYPDCGFACIDYIKEFPLKKEVSPKEAAAFIVEPVQGEGGYVVPPKDYFKELRKLLDENNILMISDEIQAGYMRAGRFLALDNFNVSADIYTMAKAIGSGLPMGATIASNKVGDIPAGSHANTFGGNLVAIAAAYEQLKYVSSNKAALIASIEKKHRYAMKRLNEMKERFESVGDVRGLGMMLAIEFVKDKKSKEPDTKMREAVVMESFYNGLLLLEAGESSIRLIPPVNIDDKNLEKGLDIIENAIAKIAKGK
ncbi:MAG: aminotransferase class III-fold pyridoxal phosphate-dependent enzyme [Candidatus Micrarchaeia archaeon]